MAKLFNEERRLLTKLPRKQFLNADHLKNRAIGNYHFERGFIAALQLHPKRFLEEAERYFSDDPIQNVRFVKLTSGRGPVSPAALFASPHLTRLRTLNLSNSRLTSEVLALVANSRRLQESKSLDLGGNALSPGDLHLLARDSMLPSLSRLDLSYNRVLGDAAARTVCGDPSFRRIKYLDLYATDLSLSGVRSLAESPHCKGLEILRLGRHYRDRQNMDESELARVIANSPNLAGLKELDLSERRIGVNGLQALGHSPHLKSLRRLRLLYCKLPKRAILEAAEAPNFRGLYLLKLGLERRDFLNEFEEAKRVLRSALLEAAIRIDV